MRNFFDEIAKQDVNQLKHVCPKSGRAAGLAKMIKQAVNTHTVATEPGEPLKLQLIRKIDAHHKRFPKSATAVLDEVCEQLKRDGAFRVEVITFENSEKAFKNQYQEQIKLVLEYEMITGIGRDEYVAAALKEAIEATLNPNFPETEMCECWQSFFSSTDAPTRLQLEWKKAHKSLVNPSKRKRPSNFSTQQSTPLEVWAAGWLEAIHFIGLETEKQQLIKRLLTPTEIHKLRPPTQQNPTRS